MSQDRALNLIGLSALFQKFSYVCKMGGAHAEGVDGGRRRPPAGFSGITRRAGA
jgi:hypothetical protein